jgi:hypothetical protein
MKVMKVFDFQQGHGLMFLLGSLDTTDAKKSVKSKATSTWKSAPANWNSTKPPSLKRGKSKFQYFSDSSANVRRAVQDTLGDKQYCLAQRVAGHSSWTKADHERLYGDGSWNGH